MYLPCGQEQKVKHCYLGTEKGLLRRKKCQTLELKRDSYIERNVKHWNLKGTLTLKEMSNIGTKKGLLRRKKRQTLEQATSTIEQKVKHWN